MSKIILPTSPTNTSKIATTERVFQYNTIQGVYRLLCCCNSLSTADLVCIPLESFLAADNFTGFTHYSGTSQPLIDTESVTYFPTGGNPSTTGYLRCSLSAEHGINSNILFPSAIYIPKGGTLVSLDYSLDIKINSLATQIAGVTVAAMQQGHIYYLSSSNISLPSSSSGTDWATYSVSGSFPYFTYVGEVPTTGTKITSVLTPPPSFDPALVTQFGLYNVDAQSLYAGGTYTSDLSFANFNLSLSITC